MRKCLDCGKELRDVEMVCAECGSENLSLIEEAETFKEKKPKGGFIILSVVVLIGIISGILVYQNSLKTVPAEPVKNAMAAFYSGDLDGYINEMYGSFQTDAENYLTSQYGSYSAFEESTKDTLINAYGENYIVETEVVDVFSYSDKMIEFVQQACDAVGYDADITDVKHITVRIVTKNTEGAQTYYIADEYSAEIGGKWYMLPKSMLISE